MAVNVDTVYQTVQALANKEQRGYFTPQEFNLFANQAQQDIFEQYIYDLSAAKRAEPLARDLGNSTSTIISKLKNTTGVAFTNTAVVVGGTTLVPGSGIHYGRIFATIGGKRRTIREIEADEIYNMQNSRWHRTAFDDVVYFEDGVNRIQVWHGDGTNILQLTTGITVEKLSGRPGTVIWGYNIVNEKPVWNPTTSKNFDLDVGEQADLVAKILKLAGISIEDQQLYQAGAAEESLNIQQESK